MRVVSHHDGHLFHHPAVSSGSASLSLGTALCQLFTPTRRANEEGVSGAEPTWQIPPAPISLSRVPLITAGRTPAHILSGPLAKAGFFQPSGDASTWNSSIRLKRNEQQPNQISVKEELTHQRLMAGLQSLLFFSNFVLLPAFLHWKLVAFFSRLACFPASVFSWLISKSTENGVMTTSFKHFSAFHEFLNLSSEALKNIHLFFYTNSNCILCHSDPCYEGNGTKPQPTSPPPQKGPLVPLVTQYNSCAKGNEVCRTFFE